MSTENVVARVYAQALCEIGSENDSLTALAEELNAVRDVIADLEPELRTFIEMPQLPRDEKWQVLSAAFEGKVSHDILGLLHVMVDRRREALIADVAHEFAQLVDTAEGRVHADLISARPLDDELVAALHDVIERQTRRKIVLDQRVDPNMIGGVRLSLGDLVVDGTTRRALHDMRRTLASTLA